MVVWGGVCTASWEGWSSGFHGVISGEAHQHSWPPTSNLAYPTWIKCQDLTSELCCTRVRQLESCTSRKRLLHFKQNIPVAAMLCPLSPFYHNHITWKSWKGWFYTNWNLRLKTNVIPGSLHTNRRLGLLQSLSHFTQQTSNTGIVGWHCHCGVDHKLTGLWTQESRKSLQWLESQKLCHTEHL